MPSLIDIRRRVRAVKSTQQITKAMKMVSSSKLRRAQDRIVRSRPYAKEMLRALNNLATRTEAAAHPLLNDEGTGLHPNCKVWRAPKGNKRKGPKTPKPPQPEAPPIGFVVAQLADRQMLPAIYFIFSRRQCDEAARSCLAAQRSARPPKTTGSAWGGVGRG